MSKRRFSNTAQITALTADITSSATSLQVVSASGYPDPPFTIRIRDEVILVGAKSGTTFSSLTRGFDSTVATAHTAGTPVRHVAVASDFDVQWHEVATTPPRGSYDDEFDDATIGSEWVQVTPSGTAVWAESGLLSVSVSGQAAGAVCGLIKSMTGLPTTGVSIVTAVRYIYRAVAGLRLGLVFADGTTSGNSVVALDIAPKDWQPYLELRQGTFANFSTLLWRTYVVHETPFLYMRLTWVTTNTWRAEVSTDGVTWTTLGIADQTINLVPTYMGVVATVDSQIYPGQGSFEFFRVQY